jgi:hypothetical protein
MLISKLGRPLKWRGRYYHEWLQIHLEDLYTGHKYLVQKVFEAKSIDKAFPEMPDTAIQTWPVGTLTDDELNALRQRAMYTPGQFSRPFEAIVFSW